MKYTLDEMKIAFKDDNDNMLNSVLRKANLYEEDKAFANAVAKWVAIGAGVLLLIIAGCMFLLPKYGVWRAELDGKAKLAEAEYSKQVQVREAESNLAAEKLNAEAEVERAKGAAEARKTEGLGMTAEQYIQYLWVKKLDLSQSKTIYLPTEGGLPKMVTEVEK